MQADVGPGCPQNRICQVVALWLFALASINMPQQGWAAAPPSDAIDVNDLFERLKDAVAAAPVLEGAWIDVDRDDQVGRERGAASVVFSRIFDATQAERQRAAMDQIIADLVPAGRFRVDASRDLHLPVSEFKSAVERLIAQDQVRFDGCRLLSVGLRRNLVDGRVVIAPRFRVQRPGQFSALVTECNRLLRRGAEWIKNEVAVVDTDPTQAIVLEDKPTPDPNFVLKRVVEALRSDPALRGAWLTLDTDDQGFPGIAARVIVFRRTLDSRRAAEQSLAITKLVTSLVPSGRFKIETSSDRSLPLSSLRDEMRRIMDLEPAFAGCAIDSLAYVPAGADADQRFEILLHGRVWRDSQIGRIADLCNKLLAADPIWAATRTTVSPESGETLVAIPPNPAMAATQYSDAMHLFWAGDYAGADRRLAIASLDDPSNIVYRYWRVIGALASGDETGAEDRLRRTIVGFGLRPGSREYVEILRAIYRIQGPLRTSLISAERRVMGEAALEAPTAHRLPRHQG